MEAESLYTRCIEIVEKTLGSDHPLMGTMLHNLAGLLKGQVRVGILPWLVGFPREHAAAHIYVELQPIGILEDAGDALVFSSEQVSAGD